MEPLRRNQGRYCGERIQIEQVLLSVRSACEKHGWSIQSLDFGTGELLALQRGPTAPIRRVYISTGIHGDEPAGPMSVLRLLEANEWPTDVGFWVLPCINPTGFPLNTRENGDGVDLNRDYKEPKTAEVRAHTRWLEEQPAFDLGIHLHEDWESVGFYLYELNPYGLPSCARWVIEAVQEVCPVDESDEIDGMSASGGIIHPVVDPTKRPEWPEAFYMCQNRTKISYTIEGPSDFPLSVRVNALCTAVNTFLK
ncbi:MAG: succinylglutamate desuccinylase [Verrucomicrobiales bacterium]|nr:succinylglutamate desuccinylase [Verrucomicrobiales bacterium]